MARIYLGDRIKQALSSVGITEERVSHFVGFGCGCGDRAERLNALHRWAERVLSGKKERAEKFLNEILEDWSP